MVDGVFGGGNEGLFVCAGGVGRLRDNSGGGVVFLFVIGDDDYVGAESKKNGKEENLLVFFRFY